MTLLHLRRLAQSILLLLAGLGLAGAESANLDDAFALLEKKYGFMKPEENPQVARVLRVFDRVRDVADKRGNRMPRLFVVNQPDEPWAFALPDGNLLLSAGAVQLATRNLSQEAGDARIAFILGHELAHLAKNDFWDSDGHPLPAGLRPRRNATADAQAGLAGREAEADDLGFLYAAVAGYPVQTLFSSGQGVRENFFALWNDRLRAASSAASHPTPEARETAARARMDRLDEGMPLFRFAVRLAHFGSCELAIRLLRQYLRIFPSREVYNNLGACYLELAREEMGSPRGEGKSAFWLPVWFDGASRAEPLLAGWRSDRSGEGKQPLAPMLSDPPGRELELAVESLEQAAGMDEAYLPARLNLATAHHLRGDPLKARAAMEEAARLVPDNREVAGWLALFRHLDGQGEGVGNTLLAPLTRLAGRAGAPASLLFNHALALRKAGRNSRAAWTRLASGAALLPAPYAKTVCAQIRKSCAKPPSRKGVLPTPPWPLPIAPGADLDALQRDRILDGWRVTHLGGTHDRQQAVIHRQGAKSEILALDGYVTMVALRGISLGSAAALTGKLGTPRDSRRVAEGEVWHFSPRWAVLVRDGQVREAWVVHGLP
ncbi:MAG: M48 family metalloprotease [Magnetococcales bacterium]|nr:M48 family metalloprotease [Magnetococcales bacterium]